MKERTNLKRDAKLRESSRLGSPCDGIALLICFQCYDYYFINILTSHFGEPHLKAQQNETETEYHE